MIEIHHIAYDGKFSYDGKSPYDGLPSYDDYGQSKKFHCKFMHIYEFLQKKRNEISKNQEARGVKGCLDFLEKKHPYLGRLSPLSWATQ